MTRSRVRVQTERAASTRCWRRARLRRGCLSPHRRRRVRNVAHRASLASRARARRPPPRAISKRSRATSPRDAPIPSSAPTSTRASFDPAGPPSASLLARAPYCLNLIHRGGYATIDEMRDEDAPADESAPANLPVPHPGRRGARSIASRSELALVRRWEVGYETRDDVMVRANPILRRFASAPSSSSQTIRATSPIRPALSRVRREDLRRRGGDARAAGVPRHVSRAPRPRRPVRRARKRVFRPRAVVTVPFAVRETMNANRASPSGAFPVPDRRRVARAPV